MARLDRARMDGEHHPGNATEAAVRTFLFADIRGYTQFIVERGDAAGVRLIQKFATLARPVLTSHQGQVISLVGDEAIAVYRSAREALRAALDLQAGVIDASAADPTMPLEIGVGLDTGEAVQSGATYLGAALNLAARLCKLAGPREVLASDGVVHVARKLDGIRYAERGFAQLKGFAEPVRVIQVIDERRESTPRALPDGAGVEAPPAESTLPIGAFLGALPATELVAREEELRRSLSVLDAVASGRGRLLLLAGEPGVGKTRLEQEIMLTARNRRFFVATGRCYVVHQSVPFYPFTDVLTEAYAASPVALRVAAASRWPHLGRLLPELKTEKLPVAENTPEEQQRLFRAVTGFLQALAALRPVAILLDDLHCADGASIELFQHLARHTRADRILLVGTYRDSEVHRGHPLEGALRDLTREELVDRIAIRRLEANGTARLISATLGEGAVPPELADMVHRQAEGNPFFTQQLVRFLVERGDVHKVDGRWAQHSLHKFEVPESVRSVVGQRTERLTAPTQELLRDASVLGQSFLFDALVRVSARPEADVEGALEEARVSGLVEETARDQYAFDHALTQQTLYAELPARRKRRLHLAAAESLEQLPETVRRRHSAELARHFVEAGDEIRAIPYALTAGDHARSVFAYGDAEQQYTIALEVAEQAENLPGEAEALTRRAQLRRDAFRGREAIGDYDRLLEIARRTNDRPLELAARLGWAGSAYIVALDDTRSDLTAQCRAMYETAQALARELGDERAMVQALLGTRWFSDFWPELRERWQNNALEALAISQRIGDESLLLQSELATWHRGTRAEVEERTERLIRQLKDRHELYRLNTLYFSLMWANLDWAAYERAIEMCDAGIRLAAEIGVPPVQYSTLKALALLRLGRYGAARAALEQEVTDPAHPFGQAMQTLGWGEYYFELQAYGRALEAFHDLTQRATSLKRAWMTRWGNIMVVRSLLRSSIEPGVVPSEVTETLTALGDQASHLARAELRTAEGDGAAALSDVATAVREATAGESTADLLDARELEGRLLVELDRIDEARTVLEAAGRTAWEVGMEPMVWRLLALKGEALERSGDSAAAKSAFSEASAVIRRIAGSIDDPELNRGFLESPAVTRVTGRGS